MKPPLFVQTIFGILGGIGPDVENLLHMKGTADRLFGDDYQLVGPRRRPPPDEARHRRARSWAATSASASRTRIYLEKGELAESNAEQVEKIVRILRELSLEIATPGRGARDARPQGSGRDEDPLAG